MMRWLCLCLLAFFSTGCAFNAIVTPVEGPLSRETPVPALTMQVQGSGESGPLRLAMGDRSLCLGRWSTEEMNAEIAPAGLLAEYGEDHLPRESLAMLISRPVSYGDASCAGGRRFELEFVRLTGAGGGMGVASDNQGNVYRLTF